MDKLNARILVIDDDETIRSSFQEIFKPERESHSALESAESELFGSADGVSDLPQSSYKPMQFKLDFAETGEIGLDKVKQAVESRKPYAAIFCDMRMPGWDGLETVEKIQQVDRFAQIIFVTAFSDYSLDDIVQKTGGNISYFCKPFSVVEVRQIATKAVFDWDRTATLEQIISYISLLKVPGVESDEMLGICLSNLLEITGLSEGLVARIGSDNNLHFLSGTGSLSEENEALQLIEAVNEASTSTLSANTDWMYLLLGNFRFILLKEGQSLHRDKEYMLRLYLEQASGIIERHRLQEKVVDQAKLSVIGQAISMAAHDMRGPVATIRSAVELAEVGQNSPELQAEARGIILECVELSLSLVNDILDFVNDSPVEKERVAIIGIVGLLRRLIDPLMKEEVIDLTFDVEPNLFIFGDLQKMLRVMYNLVKNAIEILTLKFVENPKVVVRAFSVGNEIEVSVTDTGPGIPPEAMDTLFTPFSSGKKSIGGTGLGLAIVKQIVEKHGGTIKVETSSKGTTFSFRLPRVA